MTDRRAERCAHRVAFRADHIEDLLQLLYPELKKPLAECRLLDLGCGVGTIAVPASRHVRSVLAVDPHPDAVAATRAWADREGRTNIEVREASALAVDGAACDIVIASDVIEHIPRQDAFLDAVARNLSPAGAYYLSTNNRWWPLEGHYRLPFLSFLPPSWADRYVRLFRRAARYDIVPLSLSRLTGMIERQGLTWTLKAPLHPESLAYRIGKRLVTWSPGFWNLANAFQVVGTRAQRTPTAR